MVCNSPNRLLQSKAIALGTYFKRANCKSLDDIPHMEPIVQGLVLNPRGREAGCKREELPAYTFIFMNSQ